MVLLLLLLTIILAFANGANDISKGIATLVGAGISNERRAIAWGTVWTVAGAMTAATVTQGLVATFSGKGLLARPTSGHTLLLAVACGAIGWLIIATRTGLPVSTTHALIGALCGAGIAAAGVPGVLWLALAKKAAIPLAVSPLLSLGIVVAIYPLTRLAFRRANRVCVCVGESEAVLATPSGTATARAPIPVVVIASECNEAATGQRFKPLDSIHWLSSGATSFFRGLNDTPKILALGVAAAASVGVTAVPFYGIVVLAMGAGSLVWGFRVTKTLANKVTNISPADGFAANVVTAVLVATASFVALPVSTTHVSTGAIVGTGVARGAKDIQWKTVVDMLLAWLVTLPASAIVGWTVYRLIA